MLHLRSSDLQVFQAEIYNQRVRELVKKRGRHGKVINRLAEVQVCDVVAHDETEARRLIAWRFPPEDGFVVQHVCSSFSDPPGDWSLIQERGAETGVVEDKETP